MPLTGSRSRSATSTKLVAGIGVGGIRTFAQPMGADPTAIDAMTLDQFQEEGDAGRSWHVCSQSAARPGCIRAHHDTARPRCWPLEIMLAPKLGIRLPSACKSLTEAASTSVLSQRHNHLFGVGTVSGC